MNIFANISTLMTRQLWTVNPEDKLTRVRELFAEHSIRHLPVVRYRQIVGIVSKSDFDSLTNGIRYAGQDVAERLEATQVEQIMTPHLAKVESSDRINVALEVFSLNRFHALPVVDDGELVGIITPFDIMKALLEEKPAHPEDVYDNLPVAEASCTCGGDCTHCESTH